MAGSPDLSVLERPAAEAAPLLLGATLRSGDVAVRLTEVEAYAGPLDPGSHAYRGPTPRTAVMFGPTGFLYCYFVYGMHVCANVVTGPDGEAGAVLLRAGEVLGDDAGHPARGPARLCRTLGHHAGRQRHRPPLRTGHPGARRAGPRGRGRHRPAGRPARGPRHALAVLPDRRAQRVGVPAGDATTPPPLSPMRSGTGPARGLWSDLRNGIGMKAPTLEVLG